MKNMYLKGLLLLILLTGNSHLFAQSNKIPWGHGTKLTWEDFQAAPDTRKDAFAYTEYTLDNSFGLDGSGKILVKVNCSFAKNKSWKKTDKKLTPELLKHEQGHFDIGEIYARKLRQTFANYSLTHIYSPNTKMEIEIIVQKAMDEAHAFEAQYDKETNRGIVAAKQEEWWLKIATMLKDFNQFEERL